MQKQQNSLIAGLRATNEALLKQDQEAKDAADSTPTTLATPVTIGGTSTTTTATSAPMLAITAGDSSDKSTKGQTTATATVTQTSQNPALLSVDSKDSLTPTSASSPAPLLSAAEQLHNTTALSTATSTVHTILPAPTAAAGHPTTAIACARLRKKSGASLLNRSDSSESAAGRKYLTPSLSDPHPGVQRDRSLSISAIGAVGSGGMQQQGAANVTANVPSSVSGAKAKPRRQIGGTVAGGTTAATSNAGAGIGAVTSKASPAGHYIASELLNHHHGAGGGSGASHGGYHMHSMYHHHGGGASGTGSTTATGSTAASSTERMNNAGGGVAALASGASGSNHTTTTATSGSSAAGVVGGLTHSSYSQYHLATMDGGGHHQQTSHVLPTFGGGGSAAIVGVSGATLNKALTISNQVSLVYEVHDWWSEQMIGSGVPHQQDDDDAEDY